MNLVCSYLASFISQCASQNKYSPNGFHLYQEAIEGTRGDSYGRLSCWYVTTIFGRDAHLPCFRSLGINLIEANDYSKWLLSIEVMGESLYTVRRMFLLSRIWILYQR